MKKEVYINKKRKVEKSTFPYITYFIRNERLLKKDRLIPFTLHTQAEPLNVFNYWFKVGKRSLIACVIF